jgi:hypothetical protein
VFHKTPRTASLAGSDNTPRPRRIPPLSIKPLDEEAVVCRDDHIVHCCHDTRTPLAALEHITHDHSVAFGHADHG